MEEEYTVVVLTTNLGQKEYIRQDFIDKKRIEKRWLELDLVVL